MSPVCFRPRQDESRDHRESGTGTNPGRGLDREDRERVNRKPERRLWPIVCLVDSDHT